MSRARKGSAMSRGPEADSGAATVAKDVKHEIFHPRSPVTGGRFPTAGAAAP